MPDRVPEDMPEHMPSKMPKDMPDRMPEGMPDRMPDNMPDRMPDRMPKDMPEHMPEDLPDRMPDRMPEDMPDRMPEDLPVTKCINVMVGITRSKVIYITCFFHCAWWRCRSRRRTQMRTTYAIGISKLVSGTMMTCALELFCCLKFPLIKSGIAEHTLFSMSNLCQVARSLQQELFATLLWIQPARRTR